MSDLVTTNEQLTCPTCSKTILKGSLIRTDGSRAWHPTCAPPNPPHGPTPTTGGQPPDAGEPSETFVQIAAWVPANRVGILIRAIEEARCGVRP